MAAMKVKKNHIKKRASRKTAAEKAKTAAAKLSRRRDAKRFATVKRQAKRCLPQLSRKVRELEARTVRAERAAVMERKVAARQAKIAQEEHEKEKAILRQLLRDQNRHRLELVNGYHDRLAETDQEHRKQLENTVRKMEAAHRKELAEKDAEIKAQAATMKRYERAIVWWTRNYREWNLERRPPLYVTADGEN